MKQLKILGDLRKNGDGCRLALPSPKGAFPNGESLVTAPNPTLVSYFPSRERKITGMYRIEYQCPRETPPGMPVVWQPYTESLLLIFRQPKVCNSLDEAVRVVNGLLWRYHSARVIDPWGNVVYQV